METNGVRVLAIDDEPHILTLCRLNLSFEDMEVMTSEDAEEGLEMAIREQPDVILLDWMLPHVDGLTVLRELRRHASTARIPVVMLTARALPADRLDSWIAGATAHLNKPFSMDELIQTVKRLAGMDHRDLDAHRGDVLERLREIA